MTDNNIVWHQYNLTTQKRAEQKNQVPVLLWFTGLSGSGKSTIANAVEVSLFELGCHSYLLDGDNVRHGLSSDLGFSDHDRIENIRRVGEVAKLMVDSGLIVLSAFISPFRTDRELVRSLFPAGLFIEVFVDTPLDVCESRDPKKLYEKARSGLIPNFTGIDSAYEIPSNPEISVRTEGKSVHDCVVEVLQYLRVVGVLPTK